MKTKYIRVKASERLPEKEGKYTVQRNDSEDYHEMYYFNGSPLNFSFWTAFIDYWLEEVPDYEVEMREMLEKCYKELLISAEKGNYPESFLQKNGGSGLNEIKELLTKLKTKES